MSVGPIGPGDSVGFVYVTVMTDTSQMKDQIEKGARKDGKNAAKAFNQEWERENKSTTSQIMFERAARRNMDSYLKSMSKEIAAAERSGKTHAHVKIVMSEDIAKNFEQIRKSFRKTDQDLQKFWDTEYPAALKRGIEKAHKEFEKQERDAENLLKKQTEIAEREAKKQADAYNKMWEQAHRENVIFDKRQIDQYNKMWESAHRENMAWDKKRVDEYSRMWDAAHVENMVRDKRRVDEYSRMWTQAMRENIIWDKRRAAEEEKNRKRSLRSGQGLVNSLRRMGTGGFFDSFTNMLASFVNIGDKILGPVFRTLGSQISKMGGGFESFGQSIASAGGPIGGLIVLISALAVGIGVLVSAISAALGVMTIFATILGNTVAAAIPLVGVLGSLGVAAAAFAIGGKNAASALGAMAKAVVTGDAEAMKDYNEALAKLGPNAKKAVRAAEPLVQVFKGLQRSLEQRMFEGVAENIGKLKPIMDTLRTGLEGAASAIGFIINEFLKLGENETFKNSMETLMASVEPIVTLVGTALVNIIAGLTNFFAAVSPIAISIAEDIFRIGENFKSWTESEDNRTKVTTFFHEAYEIAKQVIAIVWEVGQIFVTAMGIASGAIGDADAKGGALRGTLEGIKGKLDNVMAWLAKPENQQALREWLDRAWRAGVAVWHAIEDIGKKIAELDTPENRENLRAMFDAFTKIAGAVISILNAIDRVIGALGRMKSAVANLPSHLPGWVGSVTGLGSGNLQIGGSANSQISTWLNRINPFKAEGGMFNSATPIIVGEAGAEAVIPLIRPLNQIDPSVRAMAALIRGEPKGKNPMAGIGVSTGKTVNVTQNIQLAQADPQQAAASVVNRLVAGALR